MWYVYILKSDKKDWYYIGVTDNLDRRLLEHNSGSTKSTKPYRPLRIVYTEEILNKEDACKREWYLKHPAGYLEKKRIIANLGEIA